MRQHTPIVALMGFVVVGAAWTGGLAGARPWQAVEVQKQAGPQAPAGVATAAPHRPTVEAAEKARDKASQAWRAEAEASAGKAGDALKAEIDLFLAAHPNISNRAAVVYAWKYDSEFFHLLAQAGREKHKQGQAARDRPAEAEAIGTALHQRLAEIDAALAGRVEQAAALLARPIVTGAPKPEVVAAVDRFVAALKAHPVGPSKPADKLVLFVADVATGAVSRVADEPLEGLSFLGSPEWSADGKRVYCDGTPPPGNVWHTTKLLAVEAGGKGLSVTDLGQGNCPSPAPGGDRVVFLLNPGAVADGEAGVWVMHADGTERELLSDYGRPKFSPDGSAVLTTSFGTPCTMTVLDVATGNVQPLVHPGLRVKSVPGWAAPGTVVAVVETDLGDSVALLDVSVPETVRLRDVLWRNGDGMRVRLLHPAYSAATGRYAFVGWGPGGMAVYTGMQGSSELPKRLDLGTADSIYSALAFSPDGRYLLFIGDRPGE